MPVEKSRLYHRPVREKVASFKIIAEIREGTKSLRTKGLSGDQISEVGKIHPDLTEVIEGPKGQGGMNQVKVKASLQAQPQVLVQARRARKKSRKDAIDDDLNVGLDNKTPMKSPERKKFFLNVDLNAVPSPNLRRMTNLKMKYFRNVGVNNRPDGVNPRVHPRDGEGT